MVDIMVEVEEKEELRAGKEIIELYTCGEELYTDLLDTRIDSPRPSSARTH